MKHLDLFYEGTKVWTDKKGYPTVWRNGKSKKVHVLEWEKRYGVKPSGYEIHHKDEDKSNWDIKNLELLTNSEHQRIHAGWIRVKGIWIAKPCSRCGEIKNLDCFYDRKGYSPTALCKKCVGIVTTEWAKRNPEKRRFISRFSSRRLRGVSSTNKRDLRFKYAKKDI